MILMDTILVVDDEKKVRSLYKKLLTVEHFEVLEAEDSRSAAKLLLAQPDISLVLLDLNLPEIDGSVLYELIRRIDARTKVIVTSAYPLHDQKKLVVNADDYYDKSQGMDVLLSKIKNTLEAALARKEEIKA